MKLVKFAVAALAALAFGNAYAFHEGGVAKCEGCHTMHNSLGNVKMTKNALPIGQTNSYLLIGSDQSSTCLACHGVADAYPTAAGNSYHVMSTGVANVAGLNPDYTGTGAPNEFTPGGDFAWLKLTRSYTSIRGTKSRTVNYDAITSGHNVIAADQGLGVDTKRTIAPGATGTAYPAANLACSSCHDPHGKYRTVSGATAVTTDGAPIEASGSYGETVGAGFATGSFRLLAGANYLPKSMVGKASAFTAAPPVAVSPASYNLDESVSQTVVAYGSGMSEWCANCHGQMHASTDYTSGLSGQVHPAGSDKFLKADQVTNYTSYIRSGITGTQTADKYYSTLVPVESPKATLAELKAASDAKAVTVSADSAVMCLSCHRAHASAFDSMTRYQINNNFMTLADPTGAAVYVENFTDGVTGLPYPDRIASNGLSETAAKNAYHGRTATAFGPFNRNLCNKCHNKD